MTISKLLWSQVSSFLVYKSHWHCWVAGVCEKFGLCMLLYSISSSLSGPACVVQKEALSCLGSLSCWERWCSVLWKKMSHMKASGKALFSFLSVPYFPESKSCAKAHTIIRGFLVVSEKIHSDFIFFTFSMTNSQPRQMRIEYKRWTVSLVQELTSCLFCSMNSALVFTGYENMKIFMFYCFTFVR